MKQNHVLAQIGDPSGKTSERPPMSLDEISRNVIGLKKNLETVFANHEAYIWNEKKATNDTQLKPVKILNNQVRSHFLDTDQAAGIFLSYFTV